MKVGLAQFTPTNNAGANLRTIRSQTQQAARLGAEVVVFPEYSAYFSGQLDAEMAASAEPLDGPFVTGLKCIAEQYEIAIVAGLLQSPDVASERPSNTVVAVSALGETLCAYEKIHLYDAFNASESTVIRGGSVGQSPVFDLGGFRLGVQTCYDLRFPETTRALIDSDAQVILIPAQWVPGPGKVLHWRTMLRARAIENTSFVVGVDQSRPAGVGNSVAYAPDGTMLGTLGDGDAVLVIDLNPELLRSVRVTNPSLKLRRFGVQEAVPKDLEIEGE